MDVNSNRASGPELIEPFYEDQDSGGQDLPVTPDAANKTPEPELEPDTETTSVMRQPRLL
jgi:hypothetical protein